MVNDMIFFGKKKEHLGFKSIIYNSNIPLEHYIII